MGEKSRNESRWPQGSLVKRILNMPGLAFDYLKGKTAGLLLSSELAEQGEGIRLDAKLLTRLRQAYAALPANGAPNAAEAEHRPLVRRIREETARLNCNNVTRTQAYYDIYCRHPELHWALLAHMVSRNGGWSMTDLKGEFVPRLMAAGRAEELFAFLERGNALIFYDTYPQLRLYELSLERNASLFHLLPAFDVSVFMKPIWDLFWQERCSELLTIGLIVNEQTYIEGRVAQKEPYKSLLDSHLLQLHALLQLNVIAFPYGAAGASPPRLAGRVLERFSDLEERIGLGRNLYALVFGVPSVREGILRFAASVPHSGSRADYWPQLFAPIRHAPPAPKYAEKLNGCSLVKATDPLYSPILADAWKDRPLQPPELYDWFVSETGYKTAEALRHFTDIGIPRSFEMTNEACFALNKLELAVLASGYSQS
ncbi:DUF2515 family protein [Paenibacillus sp. HJGM_3]|uniref:DUF2515 family protein n=1 Tax=Paenibacillus sp. HJGM_3 TaxID=3379816 RepID=UPI00385DF49A